MSTSMVVLAGVIAVAAAVRSTWSPCGWSMLSTITPLTERSRGHRFGVTALWFVLGSTVGGLLLGVSGATIGLVIRWAGPSSTVLWSIAGSAGLAAAALDVGIIGPALPHHRRQVSEVWIDEYRPWVYGVGFGVQIGSGLATYIMTAAVYLTIVFAGLLVATNGVLAALSIGLVFGLARGLAVLLGGMITTPGRLLGFHRRFAELTEPVRFGVAGVEVAAGLFAATAAFGVTGLMVACAVLAFGGAAMFASRRAQPERAPMSMPASAAFSTGASTERRAKDPMTA